MYYTKDIEAEIQADKVQTFVTSLNIKRSGPPKLAEIDTFFKTDFETNVVSTVLLSKVIAHYFKSSCNF